MEATKLVAGRDASANPALELASWEELECGMADLMTSVTDTLTETRGWTVDQHVGYDGTLTIVAEHSQTGRTFALSVAGGWFELARVQGDRLIPEGEFSNIEAAVEALKQAA